MFKQYKTDLLLVSLLGLIFILSHSAWYGSLAIIAGGDWLQHFPESLKTWSLLPQTWLMQGLGKVDIELSFYPQYLLSSLLARLGLSYGLIERLIIFYPLAVFSAVSSYVLIKKVCQSRQGAFWGSLIYIFNTYFLILEVSGHLLLRLAFAIAPLLVWFFIKTLEKPGVLWPVMTGLLGFIVSFYEFRVFYVVSWVMLFLGLYYLIFVFKARGWKSRLKLIGRAALPFILILLLNLYWLVSLLMSGGENHEILSRGLFGNQFTNILYAFTLFQSYWSGGAVEIFKVQPIPWFFWFLPLAAFSGWRQARNQPWVPGFAGIALLGIFLVKQSHEPFSGAYEWLFTHVPLFNAFREASKFYFLIALAYAVLIGCLLGQFSQSKAGLAANKVKVWLTIVLVLLVTGYNLRPLFTREAAPIYEARTVPAERLVLKDFIKDQDAYFRVMSLPTNTLWDYYDASHPRLALVQGLSYFPASPSPVGRKLTETTGHKMVRVLGHPWFPSFLNQFGIKYLILPDDQPGSGLYSQYGEQAESYQAALAAAAYLKPVDLGVSGLKLYENPSYRPRLYLTPEPEALGQANEVITVESERTSPTEYHLKIRNLEAKAYLNFSELFHPGWKLKAGEFSFWKAWGYSEVNWPESAHQRVASSTQAFVLDPREIRERLRPSDYRVNPGGGLDLDLTVYFAPEAYVYPLGLVSLATLIITVGTLIFLGIKSNLWRSN